MRGLAAAVLVVELVLAVGFSAWILGRFSADSRMEACTCIERAP